MSKGKRPINYVPHNKWQHRDTSHGEDWEAYVENLSRVVGAACDRFFQKRGIVFNNQFNPSTLFKNGDKPAGT